jgi:hypothetical protein
VCGIEEFHPWLLSFLIDQLHELDRRTVFIDMLNRLFEVFQKKVVTPLQVLGTQYLIIDIFQMAPLGGF